MSGSTGSEEGRGRRSWSTMSRDTNHGSYDSNQMTFTAASHWMFTLSAGGSLPWPTRLSRDRAMDSAEQSWKSVRV